MSGVDVAEAVWRSLLHKVGDWELRGTGQSLRRHHWNSVIKHHCDLNGTPYWMLIERHDQPTVCMYCKESMPDAIVALFKFHNEDVIR